MVNFVKRNSWILTIIAVISLAATALTGLLIYQQNEMAGWIEHTYEVINESEQALTCLMDCETSYRGYLITAQKSYLEPYELCYKHVGAHLERLQGLTLDNQAQQALMPQLLDIAKKKILFSQHVIAVRDAADTQAPVNSLVDLEPGKVLMDKFRSLVTVAQANERKLLQVRKTANEHLRLLVFACVSALSLVLLGLLFYSVVSAENFAKEQRRDRELLEKIVAERTAKLNESMQQFRFLADSLPDLVWTFDKDLHCTYLNERWYQYTGMIKPDGLGDGWQKVVHQDDLERTMKEWLSAASEKVLFETEHLLRDAAGNYRWFLVRAIPLLNNENSAIDYWFGTSTDIHYRKEAREELEELVEKRTLQLKESLAEAQQANSLKAQFVSTISHEVRTPMAGIIGLAEYLTTVKLDDEIAEIADHIFQSSKQLLVILNDLLDFSKLEAGKVDVDYVGFDLRKLVSDSRALFLRDCEAKGVAIEAAIDEQIPEKICGDEQKTRQVLNNLLSNAAKFTQSGKISIRVVMVARTVNAMQLRIEISDTGMGIPEEAQSLIFQPFAQADGSMSRRFGGTGLGLSISKRFVEVLGGEIGFQSSEGKGSTFWFTIPYLDESAQQCRLSQSS